MSKATQLERVKNHHYISAFIHSIISISYSLNDNKMDTIVNNNLAKKHLDMAANNIQSIEEYEECHE